MATEIQSILVIIGMIFTGGTFIIALMVRAEVSKQIAAFGDQITQRLDSADRARERIFQRLETLELAYKNLHTSDETLWREVHDLKNIIIGRRA